MTEKDLIELGFERHDSFDIIDGEPDFYYYYYDIVRGHSLITQASDEVENDKWFVEIFDTSPNVRWTNKEDVKTYIENIKKHIVNE